VVCLVHFSCCAPESEKESEDVYPAGSVNIEFTKTDGGVALLEREIDQFEGSDIPVGSVVGIIADDSCIYITDRKQGQVYVLDRETYAFKRAIGTTDQGPFHIYEPYGTQFYSGNLFIGNNNGNRVFKTFTTAGDFLQDYELSNADINGGVATHLHSFFISDSIAHVAKFTADNGFRVKRYRLGDHGVSVLPDAVPTNDMHAEMELERARTVIPRVFLLKSQKQNTAFFAVPSNKYLVNRYAVNNGQLLESVSLLDIPVLRSYYENTPFNNFFSGIAIGRDDKLYFPAQEIIDVPAFKAGDTSEENIKTYIAAVDIDSRQYALYQLEKGRAIAPICFIGDKLWCYDFLLSRLLVYRLETS